MVQEKGFPPQSREPFLFGIIADAGFVETQNIASLQNLRIKRTC